MRGRKFFVKKGPMKESPLWVLSHTPKRFDLEAFLKARQEDFCYAFLESSRMSPEDRRHLLFSNPEKILLCHGKEDINGFFKELERALEEGFWAVGFFSYEFGYLLERRLTRFLPPQGPFAILALFKAPKETFSAVCKAYQPGPLDLEDLKLSLAKEEYLTAIEKIKAYIASGDTYQVNYTLKYFFTTSSSPEEIYLSLRNKQRVCYGGIFKIGDLAVVSFSPELFLRKEGPRIWTRPMKGTAARGLNREQDRKISSWLASDPKNQAENVMIVDLLRNDLGRVCEPGSVFVPRLFEVEKYETVFQMTSTVEGRLKETSFASLFSGLFPCGSVTGAPKIRTMEIIAELEKGPRGVYTGAFGFISPEKDFVFNVAIRTLVLQKQRAEFGIGSGIVWDSIPEKEYEECLLKARFLTDPPLHFCLLETMRFEPGEGIKLLPWHLDRLREGAAYFDFPLDEAALKGLLERVKKGLDFPARLRLLLAMDGEIKIEVYPLKIFPGPVKIGLARRDWLLSPFVFYKTTYRHWFSRWRERALKEGLFEVVFIDDEGRLLEGTITNVFLQIDGKLFTPPKELGLLPGVFRQSLLDQGLVRERELLVEDLLRAEKVYLGNALRGFLEVSSWHFLEDLKMAPLEAGHLSGIEDKGS